MTVELGHGLYDDGQPASGTGEILQPGQTPTCPRCGLHDRASQINHPLGRWFCSCGQLYDGTDREWRRLAKVRRQAIERRVGTRPPDHRPDTDPIERSA